MEKDTHSKLIEAATLLFAQKGFAAVSIRELAEAAGVNIAAVSYYFHGKEGLYQAVLSEQFAPIAAALEAVKTEASMPPVARLTLYAEKIAVIHRQRPHLVRFLHSELTNPTVCFDTEVKTLFSNVFLFLRTTIQRGIDAGEFRSDLDADLAAVSLAGIMNFYFIAKPLIREFTPLSAASDARYTALAFKIYLDGIRRKHDE